MTSAAEGGAVSEDHLKLSEQMEHDLKKIERFLVQKAEVLEKAITGQREEEVLSCDQPETEVSPIGLTNRIFLALRRHDRAEERVLKVKKSLEQQLEDNEFQIEQMQMERDVLLEQVHAYLGINSSLRVRLEEQRCQSGAVQRQLNSDLESRIRALENDKEKLSDLNIQKEKEIYKMTTMLEQATKYLKLRDAESSNWKNTENHLVTNLQRDLQKTLEDKLKLEEKYERLKEKFLDEHLATRSVGGTLPRAPKSSLRRWSSVGDVSLDTWNCPKHKTLPEPLQTCLPAANFSIQQLLKQEEPHSAEEHHGRLLLFDQLRPPAHLRDSRSGEPEEPEERAPAQVVEAREGGTADGRKKRDTPEMSLHSQLNALRQGLFNVSRKLERLKRQLVNSGTIPEEKSGECQRSLKRKAKSPDSADAVGNDHEDTKMEFGNLKNILEDARSLNLKLQNLQEEKQRAIEGKEEENAKVGAQAKNNHQTKAQDQTEFGDFQGAMAEWRTSARECEEKGEGCETDEEEALRSLASALSACIYSNLRNLKRWRRAAAVGAEDENSGNSPVADMPGGWRGAKPALENGGGDNLLKSPISSTKGRSSEWKLEIAESGGKKIPYPGTEMGKGWTLDAA